MEFNWINIFGALTVVLLLIPNIVFAVKNRGKQASRVNKIITVAEQVSRYGCMLLMVVPLLVGEFGFSPCEFMIVYLIVNAILLVIYYACRISYEKIKSLDKALVCAITPTLIFFISGYLLKHWALCVFAALFGITHIYITYQDNKE